MDLRQESLHWLCETNANVKCVGVIAFGKQHSNTCSAGRVDIGSQIIANHSHGNIPAIQLCPKSKIPGRPAAPRAETRASFAAPLQRTDDRPATPASSGIP